MSQTSRVMAGLVAGIVVGIVLAWWNQPLALQVAAFASLGCRVSLFVDAGVQGLERAAALGADRIEIYTGPWAEGYAAGRPQAALEACADTARRASVAGLGVNAGHDLSQANLGAFLDAVPAVQEVSIGHALIGEALYAGLDATVRSYLTILAQTNRP